MSIPEIRTDSSDRADTRRVPEPGVAAPPRHRQAPVWLDRIERTDLCAAEPLVWLLGAHGGAAVSTLTASLAWAGDSGRAWPSGGHSDSPLVAVVARTHAAGLRAAHDRAMAHRAALTPDPVQILGVILVADTDRRPSQQLRREITRVSSVFEHVWHIGWVEPWRHLLPDELPEWGPRSQMPTDKRAAADTRTVPVEPVRELHDSLLAAAAAALRTTSDGSPR
ncbi:DUF6668 family protein [Rhodococcus sp. SORGH_AS_0301]|uniref:DUF6668 family protein n=1 Tax=Rhodococcus sp. SORGH_AS_0301 TaxID=3041780 RepID=UPI00277FA8B2|nr:DUF6668 family protein [Rhodococcus sp. SORGH_AS_0301]MDQ1178634.1 hypothetical protein [Rhodococcus sp. SORGH_AS_0301]